MSTTYQVTGTNNNALFSLKLHRGDGMVLLAMNWKNGKPSNDFVGFAIEYREPASNQFWPIKNRLGFPGQRKKPGDPTIPSTSAPIQKFRWVHFPQNAETPGAFRYRVTPMFMNARGVMAKGEIQEADIALMRDTIPGKLNVAFTRGFVSSQAFVTQFAPDGKLDTLIPDKANDGLTFKPTKPNADKALEWMGFEARSAIHDALDKAVAAKAEVRVIAYELNLPEILTRLEALGPKLKIIIDDSSGSGGGHAAAGSCESVAEKRLKKSAGANHVLRQHMANIQHHKSIAIAGGGLNLLIYGSTNFSWRAFYVQSNNAVIVNSAAAALDYFTAFDTYFGAASADDFRSSPPAAGWHDLGLVNVDAKVSFSPHTSAGGMLGAIGSDIDQAQTSVLFSLAFLGQMTKGPIGPAIGRALNKKTVHTLGISDARVGEKNLGVSVLSPDNKKRLVHSSALTGNVPAPFKTEPTGLAGKTGFGGVRMHHKFIVLDFDTPDARVYLGSYNFSEAADTENGENLLLIKDRIVATSYMIEAIRLYDHYRFRSLQQDLKGKGPKVMELALPPKTKNGKTWWQKDWDDPVRARDRTLFA